MSHPADTTDYLAIHTCLRRGGRAIAVALQALDVSDRRRTEALARYWKGYAGEVLAHHTVEDDIFFPALVEGAPVAAEHLGRVDEEHHLLDELMAEGHAAVAAVVEGAAPDRAAAVLGHLDVMMHGHLDFEDAELVPLFTRCFDQDDYDLLHKAAMKSLKLSDAPFAVPFLGSWLDDEMRTQLFATAPLPFKVLYRVTRRGHERLAALALGAARHESAASLELVD